MRVTTHSEGRVVAHDRDEPIEVVQLPNRDAAAPTVQEQAGAITPAAEPPATAPVAAPTPKKAKK